MTYTSWHFLGVVVAAVLMLRVVRHMGRKGRFLPMPFELLELLYAVWAICAMLSPEASLDSVGLPLGGAVASEVLRMVGLLWIKEEAERG